MALIASALLLAGAGKYILYQNSVITEKSVKIEKLEATLADVRVEVEKNNLLVSNLQRKDRVNTQEINKIKEKALKDVQRVEKIAIRKSKLYEKLVNKDFQKTQNEIRELSK